MSPDFEIYLLREKGLAIAVLKGRAGICVLSDPLKVYLLYISKSFTKNWRLFV